MSFRAQAGQEDRVSIRLLLQGVLRHTQEVQPVGVVPQRVQEPRLQESRAVAHAGIHSDLRVAVQGGTAIPRACS